MCGDSATGIFSPAPGRGCAYTRYCVFPRSQYLSGIAGSIVFRGCAPVALENRVLTTAMSSSTCMPCGRWAGGEGGIGDLGLRRLGARVGGRCGERVCIRECAGATACSRGRLLAPAVAGAVSQTFVWGNYFVVASLAAVPYPALHKGAAWAWRQPVCLADLGQWSADHIA